MCFKPNHLSPGKMFEFYYSVPANSGHFVLLKTAPYEETPSMKPILKINSLTIPILNV